MSRFILKTQHPELLTPVYAEYSTVVDAPVTYFMSLADFLIHYREEYGNSGMEDLKERMKRVESKGTSAMMYDSFEDTVRYNHAGPRGSRLSQVDIVRAFLSEEAYDNWNKMGDVFSPDIENYVSPEEAVSLGLIESVNSTYQD